MGMLLTKNSLQSRCAPGPRPKLQSQKVTAVLTRYRFLIAALVLIILPVAWASGAGFKSNRVEVAHAAATLVVNSTADDADATVGDSICDTATGNGVCTLRAAIQEANALAGTDTINFNITGCGGVCTIMPLTPLPPITSPVVIDGFSQPGSSPNTNLIAAGSNAVLLIELNGASQDGQHVAGGPVNGLADGLTLSGGNSTVKGLVINRVTRYGIYVNSAANVIAGNYLGTDASGTIGLGNGEDVYVDGVADNLIGGTTPAARNISSGTTTSWKGGGTGIYLFNPGATRNLVQGNYIGTDASGTVALPHTRGVYLHGVSGNTVGGVLPGAGNVISSSLGLAGDGVRIDDGTGNLVAGNYIGTNASGTAALPNGRAGVNVQGGSNNTVGGTDSAARNVISGNLRAGVILSGTTGNLIRGNYVGVDITGTSPLGNGVGRAFGSGGAGVEITAGSSSNTIGGDTAGAGNVISGNGVTGVEIFSPGADGNVVQGNYVGTNATATARIANGYIGVAIYGPSGTIIGGSSASARNIISGNSGWGIDLFSASNSLVQGNYIGTDVTGMVSIGNMLYGVRVYGGSANTIGGTSAAARNVIAGTTGGGVLLLEGIGNTVQGNYVGTNASGTLALPNTDDGVFLYGGISNLVGGGASGAGNLISGNRLDGVRILDNGRGGSSNSVQGNLIGTQANGTTALGNGSHGVEIYLGAVSMMIGGTTPGAGNVIAFSGGDGVHVEGNTTLTDSIRGNSIHTNTGKGIENISGGNTELAPPVITTATSAAVTGTACANCLIDVFSDAANEGKTYHSTVTANGVGAWTFSGVITGPNATATATDAAGNTSEFPANGTPVTILVLDADHDGVPDSQDLCPGTTTGPVDANGCSAAQVDAEGDGICDPGKTSTLCGGSDNCPSTPNNDQRDIDNNGIGDRCEVFSYTPGGVFVIGNLTPHAPGAKVYYWGAQWAKKNSLSGGAPSSFKGFENTVATSTCGATWSTNPGNSSGPPATISKYMAVIVSSQVTKSGPTISGDVKEVVIIYTDPGYAANPGHEGTGTVLYTLCKLP